MNFNSIHTLAMSLPRPDGLIQPGSEFALPFIALALVLVGIGYYFTNRRQNWLQHSAITEGVVVDVFKKYNRDDKMGNFPMHFPKVKFNVGNYQFLALGEEGSNQPLAVGEKIKVRYNLENPEEATLGGDQVPGANPKVFYALGAVFVLIGILFTV